MAKKSFKQKEQEFLSKKQGGEVIDNSSLYVPSKTNNQKAYELLLANNFPVFYKDSILFCQCKDMKDYEEYKNFLLHNFARDNKVPFSFGADIGI